MRPFAPTAVLARPRRLLPPMPRVPSLARRPALLLAVVVVAAVAAAYVGWFRDSTFVAVTRVEVTGLSGPEGERLRAELTAAAEGMSTLHVREDHLRRIAAAYPGVAGIEVGAEFPHKLTIAVAERRPVALVERAGGRPLAVAADGTLLALAPRDPLPRIDATGGAPGGRLPAGDALAAARVLGPAPARLLAHVATVRRTPDAGWVAELRAGPRVLLGGADALAAKWAAAATALADPDVAAADYVDVRLPGRPAVGGTSVAPPAPEDGLLGSPTDDPAAVPAGAGEDPADAAAAGAAASAAADAPEGSISP